VRYVPEKCWLLDGGVPCECFYRVEWQRNDMGHRQNRQIASRPVCASTLLHAAQQSFHALVQNAVWLLAAMDILGSPGVLLTQLAASLTDLFGLPLRNAFLALSVVAAPLTTGVSPSSHAPPPGALNPASAQRLLRVGGALVASSSRAMSHALHGMAQAGFRITGSLNQCVPQFNCSV
jgi:hypothetical protein